MPHVLVIDADAVRGAACVAPLVASGLPTAFATDLPGARLRLEDGPTRLVVYTADALTADVRAFLSALAARPDTRTVLVTPIATTDFLTDWLELGVADYLVRPYTPGQLVHRVREVLQRPGALGPVVTWHDGAWSFDLARNEVRKRGVPFAMTPNELKVLRCLVAARGGPVTVTALIRHLWGTDPVGTAIALAGYIRAIRKKFEKNPTTPQIVLSDRSIGYRFKLDPPTATVPA
jgi:DNA-binding response OmpR family regulator